MKTASEFPTGSARSVVNVSLPGPDVGFNQPIKIRLEDRNLAALKRGYLVRILVDAGDLMAEIGKASSGDQANVTCPHHCYSHVKP